MRRLALTLLALTSCMTMAASAVRDPVAAIPTAAVAGSFTVLCYHEARDEVRDYPDPSAVDSAALARQFAWLRGNGYTPVNLDEIIAARQGGKPLPDKAVLLSFDDAYLSFYTRVYPLLREFGFPALLGVVGKWIDDRHGGPELYGDTGTVSDANFPNWRQLREMTDSGLVEIASHTYDLHHGVVGNPQGNLQPAATTRIYDAATGGYESDASWHARVREDLAHNAKVIERETGHRPRAIAWPYGRYNDELVRIAGELGMPIALTLDDGINTPDIPLTALRRTMFLHNPALSDFIAELRGPRYLEPLRVVQVNLDEVYSTDPVQQERNLSALLDRINILKPSHVFLQATADTDGDGVADAAYFPNRHLPLRADLFSRVAWQLTTRDNVTVFAVMPVSGFRLPPGDIAEVFEDLASQAIFDGLVFDDHLQTGTNEDAVTLEFTHRLATRARAFRAPLKTVRSTNNAEKLSAFAAEYDYVALYTHTKLAPVDLAIRRKLVFMLNNRPLPGDGSGLVRQMRALQLGGAIDFGYAPDDFLHNNPPLTLIAPALSLRVDPLAPANRERR